MIFSLYRSDNLALSPRLPFSLPGLLYKVKICNYGQRAKGVNLAHFEFSLYKLSEN